MRTRKITNGFTLMELVIALGVVVIVSGGVFVAVSGRNSEWRNLHNASVALQADIRYAQRRSIAEGRRYGVVFDFVDNRYHVGLAILNDDGRWSVNHDRTVDLPDGVTIRRWLTSAETYYEGTTHQITYLARGTVTGSATFRLGTDLYRQDIAVNVSGGRARLNGIVPRNN